MVAILPFNADVNDVLFLLCFRYKSVVEVSSVQMLHKMWYAFHFFLHFVLVTKLKRT